MAALPCGALCCAIWHFRGLLRGENSRRRKDGKSGRHRHLNYMVHPYYGKPTLRSRWGVQAWLTWALGEVVPDGKGGDKYIPEGHLFT